MGKYKLLIYLLITLILVVVVNTVLKDNLFLMLIMFTGISIIYSQKISLKKYWSFVKHWFIFSMFLILTFLITGFVLCKTTASLCLVARFIDALKTVLILLNTVLILEIFIQSVTVNDIISSKIKIKYLKYFIFMRTLMTQGIAKFRDEKIVFNIIPDFQRIEKKFLFSTFRRLFVKNIVYSFTLIVFTIQQSKILAPLIENRINHLYNTNYDKEKHKKGI